MFRWLIIPLVAGIIVFTVIFFGLPLIGSDADAVALVNTALLDWSNRNFDTMPPLLADYIAHSSLAPVAATAGILTSLGFILLMLGWQFLRGCAGGLLNWLKRDQPEEAPSDLPPIEMHSNFVSSGDGKEVIGRGMDRLDRD